MALSSSGWSEDQGDGREEDEDDGFEEDERPSRRAIGPRLSTEARKEGFPAEGMFSGAQVYPAYDSSNGGIADDDEAGSAGARQDTAAAAVTVAALEEDDQEGGDNDDRPPYLTRRPHADEWSSGSDSSGDGCDSGSSDLGPPSGVDEACQASPPSSPLVTIAAMAGGTAAAAAAVAAEAASAEDEEEMQEEEEGQGQFSELAANVTRAPEQVAPATPSPGAGNTGAAAAAVASPSVPPSSPEMEWDAAVAATAAAGGAASEDGESRFSQRGNDSLRGRGDGGGAGGVGGSGRRWRVEELMTSYRDVSGNDGSPLIAPSDVMRHIPSAVAGRDREAQAVIDALQEVYRKSLKPIEKLSLFDEFQHEVMTDADFQAKPQVLLLGQYSTGKTSMIRHFIGRDFPGINIGPEAGPGIFQVVTAGSAERTVKGSALCIVDELPYTGLGKFGAPFLGKFQASVVPSPLLEHITFVDTPGIPASDKHGERGYPFPEVVKWFADRSDLILLVFDAHKLDMGKEFREVVRAIAEHRDRIRVVLNKAHEMDSDRLLKVHGALLWSVGRCLGGKGAAPKVYVGSFWDGPRRHPDDNPEDDDDSFDLDEVALRREMMELPKNVGVRKINDLMQRARLVKIHLQIVYAVRARLPRIWGAEAAQERILAELEEVFEEVKIQAGVPQADMPDVEGYRRSLRRMDLRDLPRRNRRLLALLDDIVERDIKQCVTRAGGVRRIYKLDSAARIMDGFTPSASGSRRRATTGGGGRVRGYSGAGLFDSGRRTSSIHADFATESVRSQDENDEEDGDDDDDDDDLLSTDADGLAAGGRIGQEHVHFVLGPFVIVLVVLVGVMLAAWRMGALPELTAEGAPGLKDALPVFVTKWAPWVKPGPFKPAKPLSEIPS